MKRFNRSLTVVAILSGLGLAACQQKAAEPAAVPASARALTPATTAQATTPAVVYTCTMHPEVQQATPGKCPKCGMDLIEKK